MKLDPAVRNRQSEATECGLAALAMAASMAGSEIDLTWLRQRHPASSRGTTLRDLSAIAAGIGLSSRAVRCEVDELAQLQCPAILHWGMNHFVVLDRVAKKGVRIFDPALGYQIVALREVARRFTGVALELTPTPSFQRKADAPRLKLSSLLRWTPDLKGGLGKALILSLLLQAYVIASPFYMQIAIDEVALKGDIDLLGVLAMGFATFAVFNAIAEVLRGIVLQRMNSVLAWDMSRRVFHHMMRLPLAWFQRRRLADTQSRLQALDPIKALVTNGLVGTLIDGAMALSTAILMTIFAPTLALITGVGLAVYVALRLVCLPLSRRYAADALMASIAEQGKRLETLRAIQTIKAMNGEAQRENDWANKFSETIKANQSSAFVNLSFNAVQKLFDGVILTAIVYLGVRKIVNNEMTIGILYAFVSYRSQFMARSITLFEQIVNWRLTDLYTNRIADIVLTPRETGLEGAASNLPEITGRLELDRVSFCYSPQDPFVFQNLSLSVAAGECVAIVGASGSGKSTLMKVLSGLYQPTSGSVRLDGLGFNSWGARRVREAVGLVLQDDELLPGSIAENVAFFDDAIEIERVWQCLTMAAIDGEVQAMPMRAETFVGDLGSTLSGGQKQRILLARALYKRPKILILDEANSHLDVFKERAINEHLSSLKIARIVVSHRPETIAAADRVFHLGVGLVEVRATLPSPVPMPSVGI